jgi:hypothetical protein
LPEEMALPVVINAAKQYAALLKLAPEIEIIVNETACFWNGEKFLNRPVIQAIHDNLTKFRED